MPYNLWVPPFEQDGGVEQWKPLVGSLCLVLQGKDSPQVDEAVDKPWLVEGLLEQALD